MEASKPIKKSSSYVFICVLSFKISAICKQRLQAISKISDPGLEKLGC